MEMNALSFLAAAAFVFILPGIAWFRKGGFSEETVAKAFLLSSGIALSATFFLAKTTGMDFLSLSLAVSAAAAILFFLSANRG